MLIPRHIDTRNGRDVQLLGLADASLKGYAVCVYLRVVDEQNRISVYFITCKTKVAPLKSSKSEASLTIPRLKLCAAFLLARIMSQRLTITQKIVQVNQVRAWTDLSILLAWLTKEQRFKIFVTYRVAKIQALLPSCEWAHVVSTENPADPASRGMLPNELFSCELHLNSSNFL